MPVNDLSGQLASVPQVRAAVERVLPSDRFILGAECSGFESEFADYCGVVHCVGVANATDALELIFCALRLMGKPVATVANAGGYTSTALALTGAVPTFVDVDSESQLVDLAALRDLIAPAT